MIINLYSLVDKKNEREDSIKIRKLFIAIAAAA